MSILKELANYYLVKKANPCHNSKGLFASLDECANGSKSKYTISRGEKFKSARKNIAYLKSLNRKRDPIQKLATTKYKLRQALENKELSDALRSMYESSIPDIDKEIKKAKRKRLKQKNGLQ